MATSHDMIKPITSSTHRTFDRHRCNVH